MFRCHNSCIVSTAVVNPSLWMPMYSKAPVNALFFVFFMVVCVFYLHSLTLSVVFQVFIQAATEVHNRSVLDKEKSLLCAFSALSSNQLAMQPIGQVHELLIRRTLEQVRPHYGPMKVRRLDTDFPFEALQCLIAFSVQDRHSHGIGESCQEAVVPLSRISNGYS